MLIVLIGPPGAGKGTQSNNLVDHFGIPHLSTGEMLRRAVRAGSSQGKIAGPIMDTGDLVPDELVIEIVRTRLAEGDCVKGALFDGFPRTVSQAEALDALLAEHGRSIDAAIEIRVPELELTKRLGKRYRELSTPRPEDRPDAIPRRLEVYRNETTPIIAYYKRQGLLKVIDGMGSQEEVLERMLNSIGSEKCD